MIKNEFSKLKQECFQDKTTSENDYKAEISELKLVLQNSKVFYN
jgi:hypothetical protein